MALISSRIKDAVLILEFRDDKSRNSLSVHAAEELRSVCESHRGKYEALVFCASGRVFCSGGNLADYAAMKTAEPGLEVNRRITQILDELAGLPVPTVCAVQGDCFGGGLELMGCFDVVLASPHAMFGFWQRKIGLSFGWGGGARIERRLGLQKTRQLALKAATFGAQEALEMGLIDGLVLDPRLREKAIAKAIEMNRLPKAPVAGLKQWTPENERELFEKLWWNDEHRAALALRKPGK